MPYPVRGVAHPTWPLGLNNEDIHEVLIGGRWIRIEPGTYYDDGTIAVFKSLDGKLYEANSVHVQLRVGNG